MGTGISRAPLAAAALALTLAGCGGGGAANNGFGWLHAQPAPGSWHVVTIASGAAMAYPPTWRPQHGDAGTATAALRRADGRFLAYLNLTPRQGPESLANWSSFRIRHNRQEGDRRVTTLAAATGLHFLTGRGSCIKDSYSTISGARYVEVACLVAGAHSSSVIVAAAPPAAWNQETDTLERAIEGTRA